MTNCHATYEVEKTRQHHFCPERTHSLSIRQWRSPWSRLLFTLILYLTTRMTLPPSDWRHQHPQKSFLFIVFLSLNNLPWIGVQKEWRNCNAWQQFLEGIDRRDRSTWANAASKDLLQVLHLAAVDSEKTSLVSRREFDCCCAFVNGFCLNRYLNSNLLSLLSIQTEVA